MDARVTRPVVVVDPRASLAMWLRAARAQRKLTLDDVAKVTKIQPRILEKIEAGNLEGLPAEVFVRGFVKSFARAVGLPEGEAVARYGACANAVGPSTVARAFVETLVAAPTGKKPTLLEAPPEILPESSIDMVAQTDHDLDVEIEVVEPDVQVPPVAHAIEVVEVPAIEVVEVIDAAAPVAEEIPGGKKKRSRKKAVGTAAPRNRKKKSADVAVEAAAAPAVAVAEVIEPAAPAEVLAVGTAAVEVETAPVVRGIFDAPTDEELAAIRAQVIDAESAANELFAPSDGIVIEQEEAIASGSEPVVADPWKPTMPPIATTPSAPWKRPARATKTFTIPSLVIDDADPDLADRERADRETARGPHRVSFLPPILLDREDKSSRQGGLTLAVILLLIAATLTLSYLMRRPSVSGDGVTQIQLLDSHDVA